MENTNTVETLKKKGGGGGRETYVKKTFEVFCVERNDFVNFSDNMVRNEREQADGTLVHLHKSP